MKYSKDGKLIYEAGDWITYDQKPPTWSSHFSHHCPFEIEYPVTFKIEEINDQGILGMDYGWSSWDITGRPATEEEVKKALKGTSIFLGNYKVKFNSSAGVRDIESLQIGCVNVTKDKFLQIGKKAGWL